MSDQTKYRLTAGGMLALALLLAAFVWQRDRERQQKLEGVLARAAKDQEVMSRIAQAQDQQGWEKVLEAAEALNDPGLKDEGRAAAFARFRGELLRLKSRYAYGQLGAGR